MHSKSGEVGQVGEQSHGKEMWLQIFGKEVLFVSEMFPATTSLSHNVMCTQERGVHECKSSMTIFFSTRLWMTKR